MRSTLKEKNLLLYSFKSRLENEHGSIPSPEVVPCHRIYFLDYVSQTFTVMSWKAIIAVKLPQAVSALCQFHTYAVWNYKRPILIMTYFIPILRYKVTKQNLAPTYFLRARVKKRRLCLHKQYRE